ncbi:hypothetical protein TUZN_1044 [Thermoproteus uzoniensis 768-20]|uniref:Uncharacterized protein n=1 Tax=Thermoproteus uzoniensis (strain 768-20) TaxID=999630 RepID=F2L6C9_THEU7|nr:hypothetical protein [Thermoproteus uzoniensis]AEA12525.1 hypothetical protein TUZN_1044 [Thermoproteus uzoniensis 768-20]
MSIPGLEAGIHVFFATLAALDATALLAMVYLRATKYIRPLAVALAVLVWLSWIAVAPVYVIEYPADRKVILANKMTAAAQELGMEIKEHIFYTGLMLATFVPIAAYGVDPASESGRRLLLWSLVALLIGYFVMDFLGAWIGVSAKMAWAAKAGYG